MIKPVLVLMKMEHPLVIRMSLQLQAEALISSSNILLTYSDTIECVLGDCRLSGNVHEFE
jgi:hypothetical protein